MAMGYYPYPLDGEGKPMDTCDWHDASNITKVGKHGGVLPPKGAAGAAGTPPKPVAAEVKPATSLPSGGGGARKVSYMDGTIK